MNIDAPSQTPPDFPLHPLCKHELTYKGRHPYLAFQVGEFCVMFDTPDSGGGPFYADETAQQRLERVNYYVRCLNAAPRMFGALLECEQILGKVKVTGEELTPAEDAVFEALLHVISAIKVVKGEKP